MVSFGKTPACSFEANLLSFPSFLLETGAFLLCRDFAGLFCCFPTSPLTSQSKTLPSFPPVNNQYDSGIKSTCDTPKLWPWNSSSRSNLTPVTLNILTLPSWAPQPKTLPHHATDREWASGGLKNWPADCRLSSFVSQSWRFVVHKGRAFCRFHNTTLGKKPKPTESVICPFYIKSDLSPTVKGKKKKSTTLLALLCMSTRDAGCVCEEWLNLTW